MIEYKEYENLIRKMAWSYNRTTGMEMEELVSEGNEVFVRCLKKYNEKSLFSTFLHNSLKNHFNNLIKKGMAHKNTGITQALNEFIPDNKELQEDSCIFKSKISALSNTAKEITDIIFNAPADLLRMFPKAFLSKHQLTTYLKKKGWNERKINTAYKEIQTAL